MAAPRGVSAKVKLNKAALDEITRFVADGLFEAGKEIITRAAANAPDSPYEPFPEGEGLPKQGGVLAYVGNQKVDGWSLRGVQPKKPRSARTGTKEHSVVVLAGFGFPGRFAEGGTLKTPAHPFLTPARDAVGVEGVVSIVGDVAGPKIRGAK